MRLFGRRSKREESCLPAVMPPELAEPVIEVEKVVLVGQRELIGQAIERLREQAQEPPYTRYGGLDIYGSIRRSAYSEMANELYTIAARPWFEDAQP